MRLTTVATADTLLPDAPRIRMRVRAKWRDRIIHRWSGLASFFLTEPGRG